MQPSLWKPTFADKCFQRLNRSPIPPLKQQPLSRFAKPRLRAFEIGDELSGGASRKLRPRRRCESRRRQPIEPPALFAAAEVNLGFDVVGDRPGMLDRLAIHVEDGERAVGGIDEVDGAEPVVAGADELSVFVGAAAFECDAVAGEDLPVNEVTGDFTYEDIPAEFFGIRGAAIDTDAAAASPVAGTDQLAAGHIGAFQGPPLGAEFAPGLGRTDAIDAELIA